MKIEMEKLDLETLERIPVPKAPIWVALHDAEYGIAGRNELDPANRLNIIGRCCQDPRWVIQAQLRSELGDGVPRLVLAYASMHRSYDGRTKTIRVRPEDVRLDLATLLPMVAPPPLPEDVDF